MAIYGLEHDSIGRTTHRPGTAAAHARYILRKSAASAVLSAYMPHGWWHVQNWLNEQEKRDRKNARVIDKVMVVFPRELHPLQRQKLIREFCERITQNRAPWLAAIHDKGEDENNPHAHIIIRDRDIKTGRRVAQLSEKGSTNRLRKLWEEMANEALARAGQEARIDCRSLRDQKADHAPGRHRGPSSLSYCPQGP